MVGNRHPYQFMEGEGLKRRYYGPTPWTGELRNAMESWPGSPLSIHTCYINLALAQLDNNCWSDENGHHAKCPAIDYSSCTLFKMTITITMTKIKVINLIFISWRQRWLQINHLHCFRSFAKSIAFVMFSTSLCYVFVYCCPSSFVHVVFLYFSLLRILHVTHCSESVQLALPHCVSGIFV